MNANRTTLAIINETSVLKGNLDQAAHSVQRKALEIMQHQTESIASAIDSRASKRVLVVDDNADVADTLAQWLILGGHDVRTAYTGADAIDFATAFEPDVVLLDLSLPDSSGFDIAAKLRALPDIQQFLLVAVTGYGQESIRDAVLAAGFDEHFAKPMSCEKLGSIGLHV